MALPNSVSSAIAIPVESSSSERHPSTLLESPVTTAPFEVVDSTRVAVMRSGAAFSQEQPVQAQSGVVDGSRVAFGQPVTIFDQRQLSQSVQLVQHQPTDLGPIADAIHTSRNLEREAYAQRDNLAFAADMHVRDLQQQMEAMRVERDFYRSQAQAQPRLSEPNTSSPPQQVQDFLSICKKFQQRQVDLILLQ